ncbi:MAG: NAD(P)H-dependent oxidoreductase subunit E [Spirochaetales bacterium]|nr:NAD(P)H-dependent oxidoreductase subunit E [Spirochaetales bacterium]
MIEIRLCMGSSCFSRGNEVILTKLEEYIEENEFQKRIKLKGEHCMGNCSEGPVLCIGETIFKGITWNNLLQEINQRMKNDI